jgi:predicted DNA-binding WGR domain protein
MTKNISEIQKRIARRVLKESAKQKVMELRRPSDTVTYKAVGTTGKPVDDPSKVTKIIAKLESYDSARYTKLGRNLKRIEAVSELLKKAKEDAKQETRQLLADLFDATDAALTREVRTVNFMFKMSKDPEASTTYKWASIMDEFQEHLTPELLSILEALKDKHKTVTATAPKLATVVDIDPTTGEPIAGDKKKAAKKAVKAATEEGFVVEGALDTLKAWATKMKNFVLAWGKAYDKKLAKLEAMAGVSEEVNEAPEGPIEPFLDELRGAAEQLMTVLNKAPALKNAIKAEFGVAMPSLLGDLNGKVNKLMGNLSHQLEDEELEGDELDEYGQAFNKDVKAHPSIVANVSPNDVEVVNALWFYEPGELRASGKSSDKIWAILKYKDAVMVAWGKREGNQVTGARNWRAQPISAVKAYERLQEKIRKGYRMIVAHNRLVTDDYHNGKNVTAFLQSVGASIFSNTEYTKATAQPVDQVATLGGANESIDPTQ